LNDTINEKINQCQVIWEKLIEISSTLNTPVYFYATHALQTPLHVVNLASTISIVTIVGSLTLATGISRVIWETFTMANQKNNPGTPIIDTGAAVGEFLLNIFTFKTRVRSQYERAENTITKKYLRNIKAPLPFFFSRRPRNR
jgi:3-deoxy-D-manno-octulosonic acid (KDO) 8-phosphate synthase